VNTSATMRLEGSVLDVLVFGLVLRELLLASEWELEKGSKSNELLWEVLGDGVVGERDEIGEDMMENK